jgi:hypothetical protein
MRKVPEGTIRECLVIARARGSGNPKPRSSLIQWKIGQDDNASQSNEQSKGQMMNTNRFRNTGNLRPRRVRAPKLHWWSGFRSRSKRTSPTPYWDRTRRLPALSRLRWKPSS